MMETMNSGSGETKNPRHLRDFGLLMGGVLSIFTTVFVYNQVFWVGAGLGSMALGFLLLGLAAPSRLEKVHQRWMRFAEVVGAFNAKVILTLFYVLVFSFVRLMFLLFRFDPLNRRFESERESYWEDHEPHVVDRKRYEQQY